MSFRIKCKYIASVKNNIFIMKVLENIDKKFFLGRLT